MLRCISIIPLLLPATLAASKQTNLFVSSYDGYVFSINVANDSSLALKDSNTACGPSGAWLTWDADRRLLYCFDEGVFAPNGSVSSYSVSETGSLTLHERRIIPSGPSAAIVWGEGPDKTLGISHYNGSALTLWDAPSTGVIAPAEQFFFYQNTSGPNPRQTEPLEHHIIIDPKGQYIVMPAFGMDEIQVFAVNGSSATELPSAQVEPGSGPRHGAFWSPSGSGQSEPLFFFLLTELTSQIITFQVDYTENGLNFTALDVTTSYGNNEVPSGNYAAEIQVSPDNRFVVVSNRNGTQTPHSSLDYGSGTTEHWDHLANFEILSNGSLSLSQMVLAGGGYARNFAFNGAGDQVAVVVQAERRVVIIERDIATGLFGDVVSNLTVIGEPTCVTWDG